MQSFPLDIDGNKTGLTAIVVDDDRDTVSVLCDFLHIKGVRVIGRGYDGLEAVDLYNKLRPDVLFVDVMMDRYDGFYALEKIRQTHPDAFVITVTADMRASTYNRLTDLKTSAIIYKPYDINAIMEILNKAAPRVVF